VSEATYISWAAARLNITDPAVKRARGGDNSTVFEIESGDVRWFLKIGDRLARECAVLGLAKSRPPAAIAEMLASALRAFHSVSARDCPFEAYIPGESLVHGDACLPNIIVGDDGSTGYIDLGDTGVGRAGRGPTPGDVRNPRRIVTARGARPCGRRPY
jgi:hypothetical protein